MDKKSFSPFLSQTEFEWLINFIEDDEILRKFRKYNSEIKYALIFRTVLLIITRVAVALLILNYSFNFLPQYNNINFTILFFVMVITNFIESYIANRYLFHNIDIFKFTISEPIITKLQHTIHYNKRFLLTHFHETNTRNINLYLQVSGILTLIPTILVTLIIITFKHPEYSIFLLLFIAVILIQSIGGYLFTRTNQKVLTSIIKKSEVSKMVFYTRMTTPFITNSISEIVLPLTSIWILYSGNHTLAPILTSLALIIDSYWSLIDRMQILFQTKTIFKDIKQSLVEVAEKHVVNNATFNELKMFNSPSRALLKKSLKNNSLILKNFAPMYFTNSKRKYSYEFLPGIYQLNGINGRGKTTLFKSLSLPENYLTEKSKGEVVYQGSDFFSPDETLQEHRSHFYYLGHLSPVPSITKCELRILRRKLKYKGILKVVENIIKDNKTQLSEGEQILLSLCKIYLNLNNGFKLRLFLIDEQISRIYKGKDFDLRSESISLIEEIASLDKDLIVIIIDHISEFPNAKPLLLTKYKIIEQS
jgi:ABC-type transport system involved in cytochrome c biogenesis ATPase subunit